MPETCETCGAKLNDGPDQRRSAQYAGFEVSISGIPTKVCSRRCPGLYWYWPDLVIEVIDMLYAQPENRAAHKFGLSRDWPICRKCRQGLEDSDSQATFRFQQNCHKGTPIEIVVSGPSFKCPRCNLHFLPPHRNAWKAYYSDLADAITEALTTDLIGE
jgi:hypothetical protein